MDNPRIYIDSCPIIDLVKTRVDLPMPDERQKDAWFFDRILTAGKQNRLDLFSSTLTIAECTHVGDPENDKRAQPFFMGVLASGRSGVRLIQSTTTVCEAARNLRWIHNLGLKGADAVHVASALFMKCTEFLTTDTKGIVRRSEALAAMNLRVCRPSETRLLPSEFRQEELPYSS